MKDGDGLRQQKYKAIACVCVFASVCVCIIVGYFHEPSPPTSPLTKNPKE